MATLGAFAGYVAYGAGLQMAGSLVVAFVVAGAVGLLLDKRGAPAAGQAGRAAGGHRLDRHRAWCWRTSCAWASATSLRGYDRPIARDMRFGDIRVSPQQLETMALALAIMLAVFAALRLHPHRQGDARLGRQSRARGAQGHPARARSR